MTEREKEVLDILKENPMISQQELADKLCITRSSIAVHITNLMKKGYIKGKGYILTKSSYITVIGGSNMDIQGVPNKSLVMYDSNPGKVDISLGGVGRNIADNICRLGIGVKLISAVGNDLYGNEILSKCKSYGIDVDDCYVSSEHSTSIYVSILNDDNDMQLAISHMDILDKLDVSYIESKHQSINDSLAIVLDTNLSEEVIDYVTSTYSHIPIFVDTVSTSKCMKIKNIVGRFNTIKLNKYEAEALCDIKINTKDDLKHCADHLINLGAKNIYITLGKDGVFCANKNESVIVSGVKIDIINATGAGDAFTAALVYGYINNLELDMCAKFAVAASIIALSHENTINPNMSVENIEKILKELILC